MNDPFAILAVLAGTLYALLYGFLWCVEKVFGRQGR